MPSSVRALVPVMVIGTASGWKTRTASPAMRASLPAPQHAVSRPSRSTCAGGAPRK